MKYKSISGIVFFSLYLTVVSAFSKEGFKATNTLPDSLFRIQDSVFMVKHQKSNGDSFSSAFVFMEDESYYYFATNSHVIEGGCDTDSSCPRIKLYQAGSVILREDKSAKFLSDWPTLDKIQIFAQFKNSDVAYLKAAKKGSREFLKGREPFPLRLSNTQPLVGQKLYTIGFPSTFKRSCSNQAKIEFSDMIQKRWSEGIYIGLFNLKTNDESEDKVRIGSTIDGLTGNSGGPIINELGEVVGILTEVISTRSKTNNDRDCYVGNESRHRLVSHSFGIPLIQPSKKN